MVSVLSDIRPASRLRWASSCTRLSLSSAGHNNTAGLLGFSCMGDRMSRNTQPAVSGQEDREVTDDVRDTTESSDDEDDETFSTNLQDISIQDRTFQNILAVLVGRQSLR